MGFGNHNSEPKQPNKYGVVDLVGFDFMTKMSWSKGGQNIKRTVAVININYSEIKKYERSY